MVIIIISLHAIGPCNLDAIGVDMMRGIRVGKLIVYYLSIISDDPNHQ
jgi:hypothetical protein